MQNSGETFHLHDLGSILLLALELTLTHQFICIQTKRNLKPFHYHKRAISQLERMFLQTAIHLGQPALSSQVMAGLSHCEAAPPTQSPAARCSPEARARLQPQNFRVLLLGFSRLSAIFFFVLT